MANELTTILHMGKGTDREDKWVNSSCHFGFLSMLRQDRHQPASNPISGLRLVMYHSSSSSSFSNYIRYQNDIDFDMNDHMVQLDAKNPDSHHTTFPFHLGEVEDNPHHKFITCFKRYHSSGDCLPTKFPISPSRPLKLPVPTAMGQKRSKIKC
ncbi:hypothetical protein LXL04_031445 [Taraxacum kok-saghyz]